MAYFDWIQSWFIGCNARPHDGRPCHQHEDEVPLTKTYHSYRPTKSYNWQKKHFSGIFHIFSSTSYSNPITRTVQHQELHPSQLPSWC